MTVMTHERQLPRVLVVDDEAPLARLVSAYLERDGFAVEVAADGSMSGQWTLVGSSAIGTENLVPR